MANRSATRAATAAEPTNAGPRDLHIWALLFWPEKPDLWFKQLDIHFEANDVTSDQAKFSFALAHIDATNAGEIADLINLPEKDRYETLRTEMVRRLSATRSNKMQQLLEREEMGDRTPSQFLRCMRTLASESVTDDFLKTMWLSRLPQAVRTVVSVLDIPLDQLAAADKVNETMPKAAVPCANIGRAQENVLQIVTTSRDLEMDEMRR